MSTNDTSHPAPRRSMMLPPRRRLASARVRQRVLLTLMVGAVLAWTAMIVSVIERFELEYEAQQHEIAALRSTRHAYAALELERQLDQRFAAVVTELADGIDARDPDEGLYLAQDGIQVLPRQWSFADVAQTSLRDHVTGFSRSLELKHDSPIEALRQVEQSDASGAWSEPQALAAWLSLGDALVRQADIPSSWWRQLLHDGLGDRRAHHQLSLQERVLLARSQLTKADFEFARDRIEQLSQATGTPYEGFARAARVPSAPLLSLASPPDDQAMYQRGYWVGRDGPARVVGVEAPLEPIATALVERLRSSALFDRDDQLLVHDESSSKSRDHTRLPLRFVSPALDARLTQATIAHRWKWSLVVGSSLLMAFVLGLLFALHRSNLTLARVQADFLAGVGHELRTPLASIRLLAETLAHRLEGEPRARDYPSRIVADIDQLVLILENILSYTRLERGDVRLERTPVTLADVVASTQMHPEQWQPPGVGAVEVVVEDVAGHVRGDPALLELLVANLFRNACQVTTRSPVRLRVWTELLPRGSSWSGGPTVRLCIEDNGPGLPGLRVPPHATVPLRRLVEGSRTWSVGRRALAMLAGRDGDDPAPAMVPPRRSGSHGLGLRLCEAIAHVHHGRILVLRSSEAGTRLAIELPRLTVAAPLE